MSDGLGGRELLSTRRFCRHELGVPPPLRNSHATGFAISDGSSHSFRPLRTLASTLKADVAAPLNLHLPTRSLTTIDGVREDDSRCEIYEQATHSQDSSREPLSYLSELRAISEIDPTAAYAPSYWHLRLARRQALRAQVAYGAVEIFGMSGDLSVVSSHGLLSFIDNSSRIHAMATDGGSIVWSGHSTNAELRADLSIDLNLQRKAGVVASVTGCANGDVRLRLPESDNFTIGVYVRERQRLVNRTSGRIDFLGPVASSYPRFERTTSHEVVLGSVEGSVLIEPG